MRLKLIMLTLMLCALFEALLSPYAFSQTGTEAIGHNERVAVADYLSILRHRADLMSSVKGTRPNQVIDSMSVSELKHASNMMSRALTTRAGRSALRDSMAAQGRQIELERARGGTSGPRLAYVQMAMLKRIKAELPPAVYALLRVAYFVNVKVVKVENVTSGENAGRVSVTATVMSVLKGEEGFKPGDVVQFYFYPNWVPGHRQFYPDKEYFVPLEPRNEGSSEYPESLALVTYLDDSSGYYPISDGYILDGHNYFGLGTSVKVGVLEDSLNALSEEMKSW